MKTRALHLNEETVLNKELHNVEFHSSLYTKNDF